MQNSKHVIKNLVQLKKSVENIYVNYQGILNLQKGLKQKMEEQGDSLWHSTEFLKASTQVLLPNEEIMALEYSREEGLSRNDSEFFA